MEPGRGSARPAAMSHLHRPRRSTAYILAPALAIALAACSAGGTPSGSPTAPGASETPGSTAAPSVDPEAIAHPTGADEIVLRYEQGGGFMMANYTAGYVPHFTLYGDGTVVFWDPMEEVPPAQGSVGMMPVLKIGTLTEPQIQDLLLLALEEGGLALARPEYRYDLVADASTATFTIDAAGDQKTVSVYALGIEDPSVPDLEARAAFSALATTLTTLDEGGAVAVAPYIPTAYRASLFDATGFETPDWKPWPWPDLTAADFAPDEDPNGNQFPHRTMTPDEIEATGVTDYESGFQGLVIDDPNGARYMLTVRPLLPDETE